MGWFKRKKAMPQQAVIVRYRLSGDRFGTEVERDAFSGLQARVETLIRSGGLGEFDGDELGEGEAVLYCYSDDADRLFDGIESTLRGLPFRPAHALIRYSETDQRRVEF
ncbi:hypothetical protein [Kribbella deserti]|uniref:DUF695 domain-containing protein n=1 Tax=Kribbella deserti TaxID=1926257 RepID=A0ABV6QNV8_9ACTN